MALCSATALGLVSVVDARGFRRYRRIEEDVASLVEKNRQLKEQNARLSREIEAHRKDPKALERAARENLAWVKPGEIVFNLE